MVSDKFFVCFAMKTSFNKFATLIEQAARHFKEQDIAGVIFVLCGVGLINNMFSLQNSGIASLCMQTTTTLIVWISFL